MTTCDAMTNQQNERGWQAHWRPAAAPARTHAGPDAAVACRPTVHLGFPTIPMNGITQYVLIWGGHLSLTISVLTLIYVLILTSFLLLSSIPLYRYTTISLFIPWLIQI